jgi:hypothetical protein
MLDIDLDVPVCRCEACGGVVSVGMTPDLLKELSTYRGFPDSASELIRIAGLEAASRLISSWGGQVFPVPSRIGGANACGRRQYAKLASLVGDPAAQRVVNHWGGSRLQVPNLKVMKYARLQRTIRAEFDRMVTLGGMTYPEAVFDLGVKYRVTSKAMDGILKRSDC